MSEYLFGFCHPTGGGSEGATPEIVNTHEGIRGNGFALFSVLSLDTLGRAIKGFPRKEFHQPPVFLRIADSHLAKVRLAVMWMVRDFRCALDHH